MSSYVCYSAVSQIYRPVALKHRNLAVYHGKNASVVNPVHLSFFDLPEERYLVVDLLSDEWIV